MLVFLSFMAPLQSYSEWYASDGNDGASAIVDPGMGNRTTIDDDVLVLVGAA